VHYEATVPTVRDRIVQAAVKLVIEPILEADFRDCSYGFRPKRGAQEAIQEVQAWSTWGYRKVSEADLQGGFASLPHDGVIAAVARRLRDPWILRLIRRWLKAGILEEGRLRTAVAGTPEGGVLSPLWANAYLHTFAVEGETKRRGTQRIRYWDDYVVLCRGNPQPWCDRMEATRTDLGLTLNADKTRIVEATEGVDFLGMHFHLKPLRSNPKRLFCYRWPSTRALQSIRDKIRDAVG
jgi:RNA-directed DNA polymerase